MENNYELILGLNDRDEEAEKYLVNDLHLMGYPTRNTEYAKYKLNDEQFKSLNFHMLANGFPVYYDGEPEEVSKVLLKIFS